MGGVLGGKERDKCCNYISKIIAKPCYPCQKPQNQSKTKQNLQTNKQRPIIVLKPLFLYL